MSQTFDRTTNPTMSSTKGLRQGQELRFPHIFLKMLADAVGNSLESRKVVHYRSRRLLQDRVDSTDGA